MLVICVDFVVILQLLTNDELRREMRDYLLASCSDPLLLQIFKFTPLQSLVTTLQLGSLELGKDRLEGVQVGQCLVE